MLALIAMGFAAIVGIVGLGVDLGFITMHQRILKNASDSAALAGAVQLVNNESQMSSDVAAMLSKHDVPTGTTNACDLVNFSGTVVQSGCAAGAPNTAGGVRVNLDYSRPTFFMGLLGSPTMYNKTSSTARPVVELSYNVNASLFLVCGWNTKLAGNGNNTMNLLDGTAPGASPWPVNPLAIGQTFVIHSPQVSTCGMGSNNFKGLTESGTLITLPTNVAVTGGTVAGPTRTAVNGPDGCASGVDPHNCVMLIPVATSWPGGNFLYAVRWLPFQVTSVGANEHHGRLLGTNYVVKHDPSSATGAWSKGTAAGPVSIKLSE